MRPEQCIADDEIILRRVPKHPDNLKHRPNIGLTATSFAIRPRSPDECPSWSRASITSAAELLEIEAKKGRDVSDWSVIALSVTDVRAVGLAVRADPTDEDPGHCVVCPTPAHSFSDRIWSKLAKHTRVVFPSSSESGSPQSDS